MAEAASSTVSKMTLTWVTSVASVVGTARILTGSELLSALSNSSAFTADTS